MPLLVLIRNHGAMAMNLRLPEDLDPGTADHYGYGGSGLSAVSGEAAALLESVARFRPLIDGKKRTASTLMVLMLWINGSGMT